VKPSRAQQDYLDLVFEGRNKQYGAYPLRQSEQRYTLIGWGVAVLLMLALLSIPFVVYKVQQRRVARAPAIQERVVTFSQLAAPPPIEQAALIPESTPATAATKAYLPPVVKPDKEVPDEVLLPTVQELSIQQPGPLTAPGDTFVWL
jgi:protein TonB